LAESPNPAFDLIYEPGSIALDPGIYRCTGCGYEIVLDKDQVFPPQNHHIHPLIQGPIHWMMIVFAEQKQGLLPEK